MPRFRVSTPREVALAMLDARFGPPAPSPTEPRTAARRPDAGDRPLTEFQLDAAARLASILHARGGAVLADSVGLGKTHVAAAIIRDTLRGRGTVLVTAPASLADHWRRHLRGLQRWRWCSHTALARNPPAPGSRNASAPWSLVVVDEAHAFRNPRTRRYHALARAAAGSSVLLLTATPINNSPFDLYHLLRLFADEAAFADLGIPHLAGAFASAASGRTRDVRRIAEAIMVRRTRDVIRHGYTTDERLRFPAPAVVRTLPYDIDASYDGRFDLVLATIAELRFPAHSAGGVLPAELMRLSLLKRVESGSTALAASIRRLVRITDAHARAARDGFLLSARVFMDLVGRHAAADQLLLDAAVLDRLPPDIDRQRVVGEAEAELRRLRRIAALCAPERDAKIAALAALLDGPLRDERILVFTEYRETAVALWRALRCRLPAALLHGCAAFLGASPTSRQTVIRRFAPHATGSPPPPSRERVQLLIATDVAAEGLNLQDARIVISFDLPWNPVRLAQRIGRIDRLGSPHARIQAFTFTPDHRLEAMLRLVHRIRRKIRSIRSIGGDAPRLAARTLPDDLALVEALRIEHRRARSARDPARTSDPRPAAAAMHVSAPRRAALLCFADGTAIRYRTAPRSYRLGDHTAGHTVDRILVDALANSELLPVDTAFLSRAARMHRDVTAARPATRTGPTGRPSVNRAVRRTRTARARAAGLVHQWLRTRHPAPSARDCARADRVLALLRTPSGVHLEHRLAAALDGSGTPEEHFERLERVVRGAVPAPAVTPSDSGCRARRRWRLVAALELLPLPPVAP